MTFANGVDAAEWTIARIVREMAGCGLAKFWRELARPVILFDEASPANFLLVEIGKFFRKKRARQDSNLRPPA
jgi:hypothetical protein